MDANEGAVSPYAQAVADQIRAERNHLQLTQDEMAHDVKVGRTRYNAIERGRVSPDVRDLAAIATRADITIAELFRRAEARIELGVRTHQTRVRRPRATTDNGASAH